MGSSDSHDISRFIVGQGRTYIRSKDEDPGEIDVDAAVRSFLEGRVLAILPEESPKGPADVAA